MTLINAAEENDKSYRNENQLVILWELGFEQRLPKHQLLQQRQRYSFLKDT